MVLDNATIVRRVSVFYHPEFFIEKENGREEKGKE